MRENNSENNSNLSAHAIVFLIYVILIGVFYSPVLFSGKSLIPSLYQPHGVTAKGVYGDKGRVPVNSFNVDLATPVYYEAPLNKLIGDMYRDKKVPLWNPYQGGGTPLAAQYSTRAFFPYQIAENLAPVWSWDYFILGRLLIAGFFTYLFIMSLGATTPWSAFIGGLFYMFSGVFTWFINLEQLTNTAMMLPVLLCVMELLARGAPGERWVKVKIVLGAIIFAMILLAGQPETALYCLALAGLFYLFRVLTTAGLSGGLMRLPRVIIAFVTGLGLSSPLIILFLELVKRGAHIHPVGGSMGTESLLHWRALFNVLTPTLSYFPADPETIKATSMLAKVGESYFRFLPVNGVWDTLGGYTGILPIFLILSGVFISLLSKKIPLRLNFYFFIFIAAFMLLKNSGVWPFILLGKVPMFDMVWSLRWAGPVWVFSIAVAAAMGLQLIETHLDPAEREGKKTRKFLSIPPGSVFILAGGLIIGLYIIYSFVPSVSLFINRGEVFNEIMSPYVFSSIIGGSLVTLIVIGSAFSLTYFFKDENKNLYAILILAILELWWCIPRGYVTDSLLMKWVPLGLGLLGLFFFFRERFTYALLAIAAFVGAAFIMDTLAPSGFPPRDDPFRTAPYVSAILKDSAGNRPRVAGAYGALFPNYASAVKIDDVRYVNSVTPGEFQSFREKHLHSETSGELKEMSLWFSGRPERIGDENAEGRHIYSKIVSPPEKDFIDKERGYSMLGVGYFIFPGDSGYGGTDEELRNIFEEKYPLIYSGVDARVYKNLDVLPRVYLASNTIKASSWEDAQKVFMEGDFDPMETIVVEEDLKLNLSQAVSDEVKALSTGLDSREGSLRNKVVSFYDLLARSGFAPLSPASAEAAASTPEAGPEVIEAERIPEAQHPVSAVDPALPEQAPATAAEKSLESEPLAAPEEKAAESKGIEAAPPETPAAEVRPKEKTADEVPGSEADGREVLAPEAAEVRPEEKTADEVPATEADGREVLAPEAAEVRPKEKTADEAPGTEADGREAPVPGEGPVHVKTTEEASQPTDADAPAVDFVLPEATEEADIEAAEAEDATEAPATEVSVPEATEEALIEPAVAPPLPPLKNGGRILDYSESRVIVEVDSERDTVLVLGDVFYPGWKVKVNEEKSKIIRVNGLIRGVPLKAGSSRVVFYYMPFGFLIGLGIVALSGIFCIVLIYKDITGD